jgi:acyl-CoA-binding protein
LGLRLHPSLAWAKLKGKSKDAAMEGYIALVGKHA